MKCLIARFRHLSKSFSTVGIRPKNDVITDEHSTQVHLAPDKYDMPRLQLVAHARFIMMCVEEVVEVRRMNSRKLNFVKTSLKARASYKRWVLYLQHPPSVLSEQLVDITRLTVLHCW